MKVPQSKLIKSYFKLFTYIADPRLKARDMTSSQLHAILSIVLLTSVVMWGHTIVALVSIPTPIPWIVGLICATIHLLSPLIFRYSNNAMMVSNIILSMGLIHQITFSFFTGGFTSPALIWLGILPMLAGLMAGRKGVILWCLVTLTLSLGMLSLHLYDFEFPNVITPNGKLVAQMLIVFGWIFLSSAIILVFVYMKNQSEELLASHSKKIDDLVRVLFHDLANPLGRISIGLNITKRNENPDQTRRGIEIAAQATDAMIEITHNVRKMYAISKGRADMDLIPFSLVEGIEYVKKVCGDDLDKKKINIEFDSSKYENLKVFVEPVSFKNQVLCNIISNSIKFSPDKKTITISAIKFDSDSVMIEIKDQGIGMPKRILENLFDLNKKTTRAGTVGETGSGFGMHIMKSFVEMYDGEVMVESKEANENGQSGTTYKIILKCLWE